MFKVTYIKRFTAWISSLILFLTFSSSYCCTTIFSNDNNISKAVARSMDLYMSDEPLLEIHPRGMDRSGEAGKNSLTWKSLYGSVVITAFHTNVVSDGINEKGLAVHLLYLSETEHPKANKDVPQISNVVWAEYILDNYATWRRH